MQGVARHTTRKDEENKRLPLAETGGGRDEMRVDDNRKVTDMIKDQIEKTIKVGKIEVRRNDADWFEHNVHI